MQCQGARVGSIDPTTRARQGGVMAEQRIAFDVSELDRISYECLKCGTEVVLKVSTKWALNSRCLSCDEPYGANQHDTALHEVLRTYQHFFQSCKEDRVKIRLIVDRPRDG